MTKLDVGELRVVVPVGFLLPEEQEVSVSVDRPGADPLPIRLRLIPARPAAAPSPTPAAATWPARTRLADDGYPTHDYGGGD
ncbi:MAG: hypothetical protein C0501_15580 [Isosphaera sp.]|nr:hypothetical protein [Isosphaera sp.]